MEMEFTDFDSRISAESAQALRAFSWSDLCARLVAARELRLELARGPGRRGGVRRDPGQASFHPPTARLLARLIANTQHADRFVNPVSSTNGKAGACIDVARQLQAEPSPRAELFREVP